MLTIIRYTHFKAQLVKCRAELLTSLNMLITFTDKNTLDIAINQWRATKSHLIFVYIKSSIFDFLHISLQTEKKFQISYWKLWNVFGVFALLKRQNFHMNHIFLFCKNFGLKNVKFGFLKNSILVSKYTEINRKKNLMYFFKFQIKMNENFLSDGCIGSLISNKVFKQTKDILKDYEPSISE